MRVTMQSRFFRCPALIITIEPAELERSEEGRQVLAALAGENAGDWGGADYPEFDLPPEAEAQILDILRASARVGARHISG